MAALMARCPTVIHAMMMELTMANKNIDALNGIR